MKQKESFWKKLKKPTRVSGFDPISFEEKWGFNFSKVQIISIISIFSLLIAVLTVTLLIYTPLGYLLPEGVSDSNRNTIVQNAKELDKLELQLRGQSEYILNLQDVILGEKSIDSIPKFEQIITKISADNLDATLDSSEILLQTKVKTLQEDRNLELEDDKAQYITPLEGKIIRKFDGHKHVGIAILGKEKDNISASNTGVVLHKGVSNKDGEYVIVEHPSGITTIYKNCSAVMVEVGDAVEKGQPIAQIGLSKSDSTQYLLNFEMWDSNTPLDPDEYLK